MSETQKPMVTREAAQRALDSHHRWLDEQGEGVRLTRAEESVIRTVLALYDALDAANSLIVDTRKDVDEERELCCRDVCVDCAFGAKPERDSSGIWCHPKFDTTFWPEPRNDECYAGNIRERLYQEQQRATASAGESE